MRLSVVEPHVLDDSLLLQDLVLALQSGVGVVLHLLVLLHHLLMLSSESLGVLVLSNHVRLLLRLLLSLLLLGLQHLRPILDCLRLVLQHIVVVVHGRRRHGSRRTSAGLRRSRLHKPRLTRLHSLVLLRHARNHRRGACRRRPVDRYWRSHVLLMRRRHDVWVLRCHARRRSHRRRVVRRTSWHDHVGWLRSTEDVLSRNCWPLCRGSARGCLSETLCGLLLSNLLRVLSLLGLLLLLSLLLQGVLLRSLSLSMSKRLSLSLCMLSVLLLLLLLLGLLSLLLGRLLRLLLLLLVLLLLSLLLLLLLLLLLSLLLLLIRLLLLLLLGLPHFHELLARDGASGSSARCSGLELRGLLLRRSAWTRY